MANYTYDEGGSMALYFLLTFLAIILVPLTLSVSPRRRKDLPSCECEPCKAQRKEVDKREKGSLRNAKITKKAIFLIGGWTIFIFLSYKAAGAKLDNKVYDPFEILGIRTGTSEKEIKSHYKKLSKKYHPDKVKATVNETIEMIQNRFVDITKAYKSLTDETIRKNWELWGHPDGKQEMTMGIALPPWIVEGKNNIWVLGLYGLLFGVSLPALVGRWWFGSRRKSKDGVYLQSAESFFKNLREEYGVVEVIGCLGKVYQWEHSASRKNRTAEEVLESLEKQIELKAEKKWNAVLDSVGRDGEVDKRRKRTMILLFAYLLRLPITHTDLRKEQTTILLHTPTLLNALLTISISRNWLIPTLSIMRLHAYIIQALIPSYGPGTSRLRFAQLPGISPKDVQLDGQLALGAHDFDEFLEILTKEKDSRVEDIRKVVNRWGRLDVVDVSFKVIGERIVTPSSIVYLVAKLRILPPTAALPDVQENKDEETNDREQENDFLMSRKDAEDAVSDDAAGGWAHAPYWPGKHKPGWWMLITDEKNNRIVVPPMKIIDVPYYTSLSSKGKEYRSYKLQFQAPPSVGYLSWKIHFVSDSFVGEEVTRNIVLKVEDFTALNADEQDSEDEISDPDEDTLAGQMAAMRGGKVKKHDDESDDDESSTDDDESSDESSSDSD